MTAVFSGSTFSLAAGMLFTALLAVACVTDVRARRIPNKIVLALALTGLAYTAIVAPSPLAMLRGAAALVLGFALWIPLYAFRMMGAGDVKLFAAASAWLAPTAVLSAALLSALVGGALAVIWLFRSQGSVLAFVRLSHAVRNPSTLREPLPIDARAEKLPYGIAMAVGLSLAAWLPRLPF